MLVGSPLAGRRAASRGSCHSERVPVRAARNRGDEESAVSAPQERPKQIPHLRSPKAGDRVRDDSVVLQGWRIADGLVKLRCPSRTGGARAENLKIILRKLLVRNRAECQRMRHVMKRLLLGIAAAGAVVLSTLPRTNAAQSLPSKKEAAEMIAKAEQRLLPTQASSVPYHYVAELHYTWGDYSADGTYEVLWAAPDRFRQELRLGKTSESDVVLGDKLYVRRNDPSAAYIVERLRLLTGLPDRGLAAPAAAPREKVEKVYASTYGSEKVVCVKGAGVEKGRTICLDAAERSVVSETYSLKRGDLEVFSVFDNFITVGDREYPGHLLSRVGNESLEIRVQRMSPVLNFADATFSVPDGAASFAWCAQTKEEQRSNSPNLPHLAVVLAPPGATGFHGFYFEVAPNGRLEKIVELHPDGIAQQIAVKDFKHTYPIRTCSDRPVEYESVQFYWSTTSLDPFTGTGAPPAWGPWTDPPLF
jgi:hypothetical protein